ncbi:adenylosuccinate lyase family protein [Shimia sp. R10_1]|uniref:class-II fumarase/aspartase family protein n=1 Tax=Shimia sp. R10_1 TaxID=2821095 RepID=UPI001ADAE81C|nr:adenylosuccinate lyase family protein [Shimia sp. R10_1]MBO9473658.1 adenylosuccinate lyase family protein [Shimia sp. R10_1]
MAATLLDSEYYRDQYSTPQMRNVFSDDARFASWIEAEVGLACAQEEIGLIPSGVADKLRSFAKIEDIDLEAMKEEFDKVGFAIMPFVHQLSKLCDSETKKYLHWGSTTQDILDTGLSLQMRAGLLLIEADLDRCIVALINLAKEHRETPMAGRSFMQHAAPITFGYKVAVWLDELMRHKARLPSVRANALLVQCGGAVGTLSTMGPDALAVRQAMGRIMGLGVPEVSWHNSRDGWTECIAWLGMVSASLGKIATEIATCMRSEIGELREPFQAGRGASSAMPQKRNPIACPPVIAIAAMMREKVSSQMSAMIQEHERAVAGMPIEWIVIPEAFLLMSGSLMHLAPVLEGLDVDTEAMMKNLQSNGGLIMSQGVMMGLAPYLGNMGAHDAVTDAAQKSINNGSTLRQELRKLQIVKDKLSSSDLDELLDPKNYTGAAGKMVDLVLKKAETKGFPV